MNSEKKIVQVEETYPPWGHTAFLSIGQFFMKDILEDSEVATRQWYLDNGPEVSAMIRQPP